MVRRARTAFVAALCAVLLAACEPASAPPAGPATASGAHDVVPVSAAPLRPPPQSASDGNSVPLANAARQASGPPVIEMGSGRFIGPVGDQGQPAPGISATGPDVTLDFVNVDVRDVARSVLGNLLHVSYVVDPAVQGAITLQTGQPIPRGRVLPTLADALQVSGVALAQRDGVYALVPIASAARQSALGGAGQGGGAGYVTRAVTPQYVAAADLQHVLEPLLPPGTTLQADASRNLLIVTGTDASVADILRDISTFDVDYLRGMSFALLPLRNAQSRDVVKEVSTLLGSGRGSIGGLVSVASIDRLNAVLVTSMQPAYLSRVRAWVERLDRAGTGTDQRLYVYRVQNGRASDLATVLRRAMGLESAAASLPGGASSSAGYPARTEPLDTPGVGPAAASNALGRAPGILLDALPGVGLPAGQGGAAAAPPGPAAPAATGPAGGDQAASGPGGIRITADEVNNALVIAATPDEFAVIAAALQKLDVTPLQVVIEATIAEVDLTNQLQYGLEYYIKAGDFRALLSSPESAATTATATANATGSTTASTISSVFQGFNFIPGLNLATTGANGSVILQALSQLTRVQVLSSPNLLVLNNQPARIQVGDEVPITTQSAVSTLAAGAPVVNSVEYRDTGVILSVTPRVNASGNVLLDIAEEVSNPVNTTTSSISSPTISQRRVTSSVAVSDGQTIALGGLIQDSRTKGKDGIPFLQDIPVLGFLFGTHNNQLTRTELIVLITPHVIRSGDDARAITQELQQKVPLTVPVLSLRGGGG